MFIEDFNNLSKMPGTASTKNQNYVFKFCTVIIIDKYGINNTALPFIVWQINGEFKYLGFTAYHSRVFAASES